MMNIPALLRDFFNGQPRTVHFAYADNPEGYARATLTWRYGCLMSFVVHAVIFTIFYFIKVPEMVIFNVFSMLLYLGVIFLIRLGFLFTALNLAFSEIIIHAVFSCYYVGLNSGFAYYFFLVPLVIGMNPMVKHPVDIFMKAFWSIASIGVFFTCWSYLHTAPPVYQQSAGSVTFLQASNLLMFSSGISIVALVFGVFVKRAEDALKVERDKSEDLLHNILPVPIANRLKGDDKNPVDGFDETSILFADIVGFTPISESCTPQVLVGMLNDVFSRFDDLADKHGLEKIKTIGDAYMVAGGIPEYRKDHATAIADMALDMVESLNQVKDAPCQTLSIRVGINSGPAVAGVIGKRKFAYDLWGDTVNTAARMESHGVPGEIQVTEDTYHLLKDQFNFVDRGEIEIKGKGRMNAYLLQGRNGQ